MHSHPRFWFDIAVHQSLMCCLWRVCVCVQVVADLDLSSCTAAMLFDRLDSTAAAAGQVKADNRKSASQLGLEGPAHTAALLMLRWACMVVHCCFP